MKEWLNSTPITHRGLHDNKQVPENSMLAFSNAVEKGYGIEFDVYLTKDGKVIIHHDLSLKRSCGMNVKATDIDTDHLENYKLMNTEQAIPLLTDLLKMVDGKVFLVVEIKATLRVRQTCEAVWNILKDYKGAYCVESFQNSIVRWWKKHHPEVIRGQLYDPNRGLILYNRMIRMYKHCDFLAICIKSLPSKYFAKIKDKNPHLKFITWTVRTPKQLEVAEKCCDNYIFECDIKNTDNIPMPCV